MSIVQHESTTRKQPHSSMLKLYFHVSYAANRLFTYCSYSNGFVLCSFGWILRFNVHYFDFQYASLQNPITSCFNGFSPHQALTMFCSCAAATYTCEMIPEQEKVTICKKRHLLDGRPQDSVSDKYFLRRHYCFVVNHHGWKHNPKFLTFGHLLSCLRDVSFT